MNGIHDMGGLHGFGKVEVESDEPVFHSRWESRIFCMTQILDTTGIWNLDEHRHEIEKMTTISYLQDGYYGRWLFAMEQLLVRKGILYPDDVERRIEDCLSGSNNNRVIDRNRVNWPIPDHKKIRWGAWRKEIEVTPIFVVGQIVRVKNNHPEGHTRITSYTRGKCGVVNKINAQAWVFPDTRAHHQGEKLQPVYNIRFSARELWGEQAETDVFTHVDLSQDYLESC
ncbi:nitrile hydratase subunit beta [Burkholderia vietnamiensis]